MNIEINQVVQNGIWLLPCMALFYVASRRFSAPPTNRFGTTFNLFWTGVIVYYASLIGLWVILVALIKGGVVHFLDILNAPPEVVKTTAPLVAMLIIMVGSLNATVSKVDNQLREFCLELAAIPKMADQLTLELSKAKFRVPDAEMRQRITKYIEDNIGPNAVDFRNSDTMAHQFTRAVSLYWMFVAPERADNTSTVISPPVYEKVMKANESTVTAAHAQYNAMLELALHYFTTTNELEIKKERLQKAIADLTTTVCKLVAHCVLYGEWAWNTRPNKLANLGFEAKTYSEAFGIIQFFASIFAAMALLVMILFLVPRNNIQKLDQILVSAAVFAVQIGISILASTIVAHRYIQRGGKAYKDKIRLIVELVAAGLVAIGMSAGVTVGLPVISSLVVSGTLALDEPIQMFKERAAGLLVPFGYTLSLGVLCSYLGKRSWRSIQVASLGAICNGLAIGAVGIVVARLLDPKLLSQYKPGWEQLTVIIALSIVGAVVGGMVSLMFRRSERVFQTDRPPTSETSEPEASVDASAVPLNPYEPARQVAPLELGGYSREIAGQMEGRYVCFRPMFSNSHIVNAYLVTIHWDEQKSHLVFEEQSRSDRGYIQRGKVCVPDGKPYMNLVTLDRGAIRVIAVSRPDAEGLARGLVLTLSNSTGMHFTPASAPIVLRRLGEERPQLGFVHPGTADYELYRTQIETVMPDYGTFGMLRAAEPERRASEGFLTVVQ